MSNKLMTLFFIILVAIAAVFMSSFVVTEKEMAIKLKFGEITQANYEPGLYFKIPGVEKVKKFDKRVQTLSVEKLEYITSEKKKVHVDAFLKWRIDAPDKFYLNSRNDRNNVENLLKEILKNSLRIEFRERTIQQVISKDRLVIMKVLKEKVGESAAEMGIKVLDVRMKKIELPRNISEEIFKRMRADWGKITSKFEAEGEKEKRTIEADANRQKTVILAEAYKKSQKIRGEGDAAATNIYIDAYSADPEFFSFYKSLAAYRNVFSSGSDVFVLESDSEFFKYFKAPKTK
ncbi:MAG: protease modulator HflC [Gammaproteobacteria bacterium]|nr:MAG: protease modulator HflC [Gammaproteobacteria bacterium]